MTRTRLGLAFAVAAILALGASRVWLLPVHLSSNPNEGWNAFQAARAMGAGALYPPPGALTSNNYPPLSFYVVGWLGRLVGDNVVAGRILSLASVLAVAGGVALAIRKFSPGDAVAPSIGALLFLAFNATEFRAYLAMNDPQWFGHALMTAAFVLLIPDRPDAAPATSRVVAAAVLIVAGGLVKHNLMALPVAATVWLALRHPRSSAIWAAAGAGTLLLAAAVCLRLYGPDVFADVLMADRHASALRMFETAGLPLLAVSPLVVVSAGLLRDRRGDPRCDLMLLAVVLSVPLGVLQRSGQGVNVNAHFEALIATCIAAGAVLAKRKGDGSPLRVHPLVILLAPFLVLVPTGLRSELKEFTGRPAAQEAWTSMQGRIADTPGPVACETLALCYWAGKDFAVDVFLYGQRVAGHGDASALRMALQAGRLTAVELDPPKPLRSGDVENPVKALLIECGHVRFVASDGRRLLVLRPRCRRGHFWLARPRPRPPGRRPGARCLDRRMTPA